MFRSWLKQQRKCLIKKAANRFVNDQGTYLNKGNLNCRHLPECLVIGVPREVTADPLCSGTSITLEE